MDRAFHLARWWNVGPASLDLLVKWNLLGDNYGVLGRGILTTIHEGGLMGAWDLECGERLLVHVAIQTAEEPGGRTRLRHTIKCQARTLRHNQVIQTETHQAVVEISDKMVLAVKGASESLELATEARWNTLAAGDTVRGALAYGLWAYLYGRQPRPRGLAHIALASTTLATMKCYAGSFVNYLRLLDSLRNSRTWTVLWGTDQTIRRLSADKLVSAQEEQ